VGIGPSDIVLVQTKSNGWPGAVEMEAIRNFPCPSRFQEGGASLAG
jgi:hypothetical protein